MDPQPLDVKAISAEMFGVPAATSAEGARREFLDRLEGVFFLPPEPWCAGLKQLDDRPATYPEGLLTPETQQRNAIRNLLGEFCQEYWQLEIDERRQHFLRLNRLGKNDPFVQTQLERLKAGLEIEVDEFAELRGTLYLIARIIRDTFALLPIERSFCRNERLVRLSKKLNERNIASSFWDEAPRIAALDRYLLKRIEFECHERNPTLYERIMKVTGLHWTGRDWLWVGVAIGAITVVLIVSALLGKLR